MSKPQYKLISQSALAQKIHVYTVFCNGVHIAIIHTMEIERGCRVRIDILYANGEVAQFAGWNDSYPFYTTLGYHLFNDEVHLFNKHHTLHSDTEVPGIMPHEAYSYIPGLDRIKLFNYKINKLL